MSAPAADLMAPASATVAAPESVTQPVLGAGTGTALRVAQQSCVTTRPYLAVDHATGDPVGLDEIDTRVGWLLDLITAAGNALVSQLWRPATFDILAAGADRRGRRLPAQGHVAAARLGWLPPHPEGLYVPSRVDRVIAGQAVSTLRTLAYRDTAIAALAARFDPDTGHLAPSAAGDAFVPAGFARGVRRQLRARHRKDPDTAVGAGLRITDVQRPPAFAPIARRSCADKQLAEIAATPAELAVTVKLPTCPSPAGRGDWRRVRMTCAIPTHLRGRPITDWHLPTREVDRRGLLLRCAITEMVPVRDADAAAAAVGLDWSPSTLGAAAAVTAAPDGLVSGYDGWTYDDRGLGIKLARLQAEGQLLHRKAARLRRLAATAPAAARSALEAKIAVLDGHRCAVGAKRGKINRELAFHFARQVTDLATAAGAGSIAVEDLTTLETRGHGRANNNRAAQSARRRAVMALSHTAARADIEVITVPARGSSSLCPGCDDKLTRPGGYQFAWCPNCEVGGNRDHVAGVNLAKRVLAATAKVVRRRTQMPAVTTAEHAPVRKCRDKTMPTPRRPRHRRARNSVAISCAVWGEVTSSNHVPAPQASVWDTVKPVAPLGGTGSREVRVTDQIATTVARKSRDT